jgi:hypothetical protein
LPFERVVVVARIDFAAYRCFIRKYSLAPALVGCEGFSFDLAYRMGATLVFRRLEMSTEPRWIER